MSKKPLTKPAAIAAYKKAIMGTTIYRHCSDYMRVTICCFILFLTNFIHCIISMFTVVQWSYKWKYFFCHLLQCRETYWIESLHTVMLIYVAKRIHFGDDIYNMRVELAVLDWVMKWLMVHSIFFNSSNFFDALLCLLMINIM